MGFLATKLAEFAFEDRFEGYKDLLKSQRYQFFPADLAGVETLMLESAWYIVQDGNKMLTVSSEYTDVVEAKEFRGSVHEARKEVQRQQNYVLALSPNNINRNKGGPSRLNEWMFECVTWGDHSEDL